MSKTANPRPQIADEPGCDSVVQRCAPLAMERCVRQQHRVAKEFEQAPRSDAAHLQRFGFHLPGTWIGDQPLDVGCTDDDMGPVAARDDRSQWPITPKETMRVPIEVGRRYDHRFHWTSFRSSRRYGPVCLA